MRTIFFAYPAMPDTLATSIRHAAEAVGDAGGRLNLRLWPQMEKFGRNIPDEVRDNISKADVLVCDVTQPNTNVYYEIGYG